MKILVFGLLAALPTAAMSHEVSIGNRLDFKTEILEENYGDGVIHLPAFSKAKALSHTNLDGSFILANPKYCYLDPQSDRSWEVYDRRYSKSRAEFTTEFGSTLYRFDVKADVKSRFKLSGDLKVQIQYNFESPDDSFAIYVDSFDLDRGAMSVVDGGRCEVYEALLRSDAPYLPDDTTIIRNAFYLTGSVQSTFSVQIEGSGSGKVSTERLVEFLNKVGVPKRISKLFSASGELSVGGGYVQSGVETHYFGDADSFASAFIPYGVVTYWADALLETIDGLGGFEVLDEAMQSVETADLFLKEVPQLDVLSEETILQMFGGEGAVPYQDYPSEKRTQLARYLTRVLELNRTAGRL